MANKEPEYSDESLGVRHHLNKRQEDVKHEAKKAAKTGRVQGEAEKRERARHIARGGTERGTRQ